MPKIIVKIKHLKTSKSVGNFVNYIAKRDSVDMSLNQKVLVGKPTKKQVDFIDKMLEEYPDGAESFEYEEYKNTPTKQTASNLITHLSETNPESFESNEIYLNYIATRPKVEIISEHGLFGNEDEINLADARNEIINSKSVIWTPIVSLKSEDAIRLGYDKADAWRELIRSKQMDLAEIFNIPLEDFNWYGAFHNEAGHPHLHMVVYSSGSKRGFINETRIEKVKSLLANEIFKDEMYELYDSKSHARDKISDEAKKKLHAIGDSIRKNDFSNSEVCSLLDVLSQRLLPCKGKKTYAYLPKEEKQIVDEIFRKLAENEEIKNMYDEWCSLQQKIVGFYHDKQIEFPPLVENKEFKKIKNAIVSEAVNLGNNLFFDKEADKKTEEKNKEEDTDYSPDRIEFAEKKSETGLLTEQEQEILGFDIQSRYICDFKNGMKNARTQLYSKKNYEESYNAMVSQVKRGNVPAMFELAKMYQSGLYVDKDDKKMNLLYKKALEGYLKLEEKAPSDFYEYQIGRIYTLETENQDMGKAIEWFENSAENGNKFAMFSLANIYYYGNGTDVDYFKAFNYYKESADKGCTHSYYRLGYMFRNGMGCVKNTKESDVWFAKMISLYSSDKKLQNGFNCYRLGQLYEKGWGSEIDFDKAKEYYLIASKDKNSNAEFALARIYFKEGNEEECLKYIELAEEHGNEYAREWYEKVKEYQNNQYQPSVIESAANLFCRLASMIENDTDKKSEGFNKTIVDSKERKRIIKKKQSLGIKMG